MPYKDEGTLNKYSVSFAAYNRMFKLLADDVFSHFLGEIRNKYFNRTNKTPAFKKGTKKEISEFLVKNKYPLSLTTPFYNMVTSEDFEFDFPLEDGIAISVGGEIITSNTATKSHANAPDKRICIEISSKVSLNRVKNFIDHYADLINTCQNKLQLPDEYKDTRSMHSTALRIVIMKDYRDMSFGQIERLDDFDTQELPDEDTMKKIYKRYKDLFKLPIPNKPIPNK